MFCRKCGNEIPYDSVFCPNCGVKIVLEEDGKNDNIQDPILEEEHRPVQSEPLENEKYDTQAFEENDKLITEGLRELNVDNFDSVFHRVLKRIELALKNCRFEERRTKAEEYYERLLYKTEVLIKECVNNFEAKPARILWGTYPRFKFVKENAHRDIVLYKALCELSKIPYLSDGFLDKNTASIINSYHTNMSSYQISIQGIVLKDGKIYGDYFSFKECYFAELERNYPKYIRGGSMALETAKQAPDTPTAETDVLTFKNKLKKIIIFAGAFVAVLAMALFAVILPQRHGELYYIRDTVRDCYIIQGAKDNVTDVKIPNTIWFKPVREIEDEAFEDSNIESISISQSVKEIGESAFANCNKLRTVEFRNDYEAHNNDRLYIRDNAFYNCYSLSSLTLPNTYISFIEIGNGAFYKCKSLHSFDFSRIREIGAIAFAESGLRSVSISWGNVGQAAFSKCPELDAVNIGENIKLESHVFEFCTNLKKATIIPTTIPAYTFSACSSLETVEWYCLAETAEIGNYAC